MLIASALVLACVGVSNAAPVTFNLSQATNDSQNYNNLQNSFTLNVNGLTAIFSAGAFTNDLDASGDDRNITGTSNGYTVGGPINTLTTPANEARIGRYNGGAGVTNSPGDGSHQVESSGWSDFITASFWYNGSPVDVEMSSVSFSLFNPSFDDFRWGYDLSGDGDYGTGDFLSFQQNSNPFSNFSGVESHLFMFGAFDANDAWKLNSVTVDFTPTTPVPLPAGGLLLLSGLGVFAMVRRRQSS